MKLKILAVLVAVLAAGGAFAWFHWSKKERLNKDLAGAILQLDVHGVSFILDQGADPNALDSGGTPLVEGWNSLIAHDQEVFGADRFEDRRTILRMMLDHGAKFPCKQLEGIRSVNMMTPEAERPTWLPRVTKTLEEFEGSLPAERRCKGT